MRSALRSIVAITIGLGSLDLAVIAFVLGPAVVPDEALAESDRPVPAVPVTAPEPIEPREPRVPIELEERVYFATDSALLDDRARTTLATLAARADAGTITLEGHADARGPEAVNLALSKQRAVAVAEQLVSLGVPRDRIAIDFVGASASSGQLWRDRRVDIRLTGGDR